MFYSPQISHASLNSTEADDSLWVDRYRPKTFTDLMGNDRVAREAMEWLKQWDKCVFGKSSKGKKRKRDDEEENFDMNDPHQRPKQRVRVVLLVVPQAHTYCALDTPDIWTSWSRKNDTCTCHRETSWL